MEEIRDDLAELENEFYESPCSCCGGDEEDEDYDDFSEEPDEHELEGVTKSRSYVPLTPEPKTEKPEEKTESFTPLKDTVEQTVEKAEDAIENVEEFFDEEDASDEEPPLKDN